MAEIFLGQAQPVVAGACQTAVEAFDDEHFLVVEALNVARGHGQAKGGEELGAQPLVFDRCAHVGLPVAHQTEGQLEDVGGRCGAQGPAPLALVPGQRGFLLRAGNRDAEIPVVRGNLAEGGGRGHRALEDARHAGFVEGLGLDAEHVLRRRIFGKKLHRTHAVAPDGLQEREGVAAVGAETGLQPGPDALAVGEQVVEVVVDDLSP